MKLRDLYREFKNRTPDEQAEFIHNYRLQRERDFNARRKTIRLKKADLTSEQILMMKDLGITITNLNQLRKES